jgi:hypothetical protein
MFDLFSFLRSEDQETEENSTPDGKLKFPVTFHDELPTIGEIQNLLSLDPPKKKEQTIRVVELGKKNKNKKGLF